MLRIIEQLNVSHICSAFVTLLNNQQPQIKTRARQFFQQPHLCQVAVSDYFDSVTYLNTFLTPKMLYLIHTLNAVFLLGIEDLIEEELRNFNCQFILKF